ncbi:hypothetical protein T4B_8363 [Trichinella pseudospiralis]|uniref:Uncharacterized protein n=2 Tax=Trichinella pseudospiralis TaxID=6337 RepID=A0A0V1FIJ6_TRIPS|nr:hypothetical protein T4A_11647 [Trichinella pseudospiralis]KRY85863.1 hypothetical protein T4D_1232 [Trichinella pseudospiralis]KRZ25600.1 hypothetical protein T4B_8363 [Trichinella pseudospiralis]KRZ39358.1 hypothetical protein T4C_9714 [Trichinella pseudospiralis]
MPQCNWRKRKNKGGEIENQHSRPSMYIPNSDEKPGQKLTRNLQRSPEPTDQAGQLTVKATASNRTISIKLVDSQSQ